MSQLAKRTQIESESDILPTPFHAVGEQNGPSSLPARISTRSRLPREAQRVADFQLPHCNALIPGSELGEH